MDRRQFTSGAVLSTLMFRMYACAPGGPAWLSQVTTILAAAGPAAINILEIIAIAQGKSVDTALVSKLIRDSAALKKLVSDYAAAIGTNGAANACGLLMAGINTYSADIQEVLALAQVVDPTTATKIASLSLLIGSLIVTIIGFIPACQAATPIAIPHSLLGRAGMRIQSLPTPVKYTSAKDFIAAYNKELVKPTGNAAVDAYTKRHELHEHGQVARTLSLGLLK